MQLTPKTTHYEVIGVEKAAPYHQASGSKRKCPDELRAWAIVSLPAPSEECNYSLANCTHPE